MSACNCHWEFIESGIKHPTKNLPCKEGLEDGNWKWKHLPCFSWTADDPYRCLPLNGVNPLNLLKQRHSPESNVSLSSLVPFYLALWSVFKRTREEAVLITVLVVSVHIAFFWKRWSWLPSWFSSPASGLHWCQMLLLLLKSRRPTHAAPLQWNRLGKTSLL